MEVFLIKFSFSTFSNEILEKIFLSEIGGPRARGKGKASEAFIFEKFRN